MYKGRCGYLHSKGNSNRIDIMKGSNAYVMGFNTKQESYRGKLF